MASVLKVDKLDPQSGTALEIGSSGDTITIPSGATFTQSGTMNASAITTGTIDTARLGSGTASSSTVLYGDNTWAAAGGGKVLQVIYQEKNSDSTMTSTSFATFFTSAITPSATSSKILVMLSLQFNLYGNGTSSNPNGVVQILDNDDASLCKAFGNASGNVSGDQTDQWDSSLSLQILHSPSSVSELTYEVSARAGAGRFGIMGSGVREVGTSLTLIEIGA